MGKKCRVYKKGNTSFKEGGDFQTTQDSNHDDIAGQKKNDFANWLKKTSQDNIYKKNMQSDLDFVRTQAQVGIEVPEDPSDMSTTHGYMDFLETLPDQSRYLDVVAEETPQVDDTNPTTSSFSDRFKEGFNEVNEQNPYLIPTAGIAAMQGLAYFGNRDERAAEQKRLDERQSNVHNVFATVGQDRGDYMVNTPGIGDPLKPDEHVRKGFNTKVAQFGGTVGDELDLTEEEIAGLIAQGYKLDII